MKFVEIGKLRKGSGHTLIFMCSIAFNVLRAFLQFDEDGNDSRASRRTPFPLTRTFCKNDRSYCHKLLDSSRKHKMVPARRGPQEIDVIDHSQAATLD